MNHKIEEVNNIKSLLDKHSIELSQTLVFIPENFNSCDNSSDFIYSETTTDLRKVFRNNNEDIRYLTDDKPLLRSRKSADWIGPSILICLSALIENPNLLNVSLNLISNYLYDFFKGVVSDKKVKFEVIIESKKKEEFKKVTYEGSIEGIPELESVIKRLKK